MDTIWPSAAAAFAHASACWKRKAAAWKVVFIRPEDVVFYEPYVDGVKLATRTNPNPLAVLKAYTEGLHTGNLLGLTEPSFSKYLYPAILENSRIPENYLHTRLSCRKECWICSFCLDVYTKSMVNLKDFT